MTNFERIKAMSVEELQEILRCDSCIYGGITNMDCMDNDCQNGKIAYLNAESEE